MKTDASLCQENISKSEQSLLKKLEKDQEKLKKEIQKREKVEKEIHFRMKIEKIVNDISTSFLGSASKDIDKEIKKALIKIGKIIKPDRIFISLFSKDRKYVSDNFDWRAPGVPSIKKYFQNYKISERPNIQKMMRDKKSIVILNKEEAPELERTFFPKFNIESSLIVPIILQKKDVIGMIGLDSSKKKKWKEHTESLLRIVGEIFANSFWRKEMEKNLEKKIQIEKIITEVSTDILGARIADMDRVIEKSLKKVGEKIGVDRSYIFLYRDDGKYMDNVYEWSRKGISSEKDNLQDIFVKDFPWWDSQIKSGKTVMMQDIKDLPPEAKKEKKEFRNQNIKSLIGVPIIIEKKKVIGSIGFDMVDSKKKWSKNTQTVLQILGEIFANAMLRKKSEEELEQKIQRERIITSISTKFTQISFDEIDREIIRSFKKIGKNIAADRVFISLFSEDQKISNNTHSWEAKGVSCVKENFQNIKLKEQSVLYDAIVLKKECISVYDSSKLKEPEKSILQKNKIISSLLVPLVIKNGKVIGVIGIHSTKKKKKWSKNVESFLRIIGEIFAHSIERKKTQNTLEISEARNRAILLAIPDIFFRMQKEGKIFKYDRIYSQKYKIYENFSKKTKKEIEKKARISLKEGKINRVEFQYIDTDQNKRIFEARLSPISKKNVLVLCRDITEEKEIEYAKEKFILLTSHELRTPLTTMKMALEMCEHTSYELFDEKQKSYFVKIKKNAERMNEIIRDIMSISKIEMRTLEVIPETRDFRLFLSDILDMFASQICEKNISVYLEGEEKILMFDPSLLKTVLENLISNAIKYTSEEGNIGIHVLEKENAIEFSVCDDGIGISKMDQKNIFEKFFRSPKMEKTHIYGTGLGLYIAKLVVEYWGGEIWCTSEPKKGSCFSFTLPK